MCWASSGSESRTKVSVGVNRTPVCRPTSLRNMPLADSSATALAVRSSSPPRTV